MPLPAPSELVTLNWLVGWPSQLKYGAMTLGDTIAWLKPNGTPCLSAVSKVKSLLDEPVCTPPVLPSDWVCTAQSTVGCPRPRSSPHGRSTAIARTFPGP